MNKAIIFFHGFQSSRGTNKFSCIEHENKFCISVDYSDVKSAMSQYESLIESVKSQFDEIVFVGHSFGAFFANYYANKYDCKALMISPSVNPALTLTGRVDGIELMDLKFEYGSQKHIMMIEKEDEVIPFSCYEDIIKNHPENYEVLVYEGGDHRICRSEEINYFVDDLLNKAILFFCD